MRRGTPCRKSAIARSSGMETRTATSLRTGWRSTRASSCTPTPRTVDPIAHEVLRHALWNVNMEHGKTIMRISGSPICAYGHDFNPAILDERGDYVFFGPFLQYLGGGRQRRGQVDAGEPLREPGIRRRRHVPHQRPLDRRDPPVGRRGHRPGLRRGEAVLLGRQHAAPVGPRRHRAGRLQPHRPGRLLGGALHPAGEDRRGRRASGATSRSCTCATRGCPTW